MRLINIPILMAFIAASISILPTNQRLKQLKRQIG